MPQLCLLSWREKGAVMEGKGEGQEEFGSSTATQTLKLPSSPRGWEPRVGRGPSPLRALRSPRGFQAGPPENILHRVTLGAGEGGGWLMPIPPRPHSLPSHVSLQTDIAVTV